MTLVIPRGSTPDALLRDRPRELGRMTAARPCGAGLQPGLIYLPRRDCGRSVSPARSLTAHPALRDKTQEANNSGVPTSGQGIAGFEALAPFRKPQGVHMRLPILQEAARFLRGGL